MSENAMVVQFNKGSAQLKNFLTMEDDCGLVIPISVVPRSVKVTAWDRSRASEAITLPMSSGKSFVMSGRTTLSVNSFDPLVCVIFCLAAGGNER